MLRPKRPGNPQGGIETDSRRRPGLMRPARRRAEESLKRAMEARFFASSTTTAGRTTRRSGPPNPEAAPPEVDPPRPGRVPPGRAPFPGPARGPDEAAGGRSSLEGASRSVSVTQPAHRTPQAPCPPSREWFSSLPPLPSHVGLSLPPPMGLASMGLASARIGPNGSPARPIAARPDPNPSAPPQGGLARGLPQRPPPGPRRAFGPTDGLGGQRPFGPGGLPGGEAGARRAPCGRPRPRISARRIGRMPPGFFRPPSPIPARHPCDRAVEATGREPHDARKSSNPFAGRLQPKGTSASSAARTRHGARGSRRLHGFTEGQMEGYSEGP
jgi:hypothetical protein